MSFLPDIEVDVEESPLDDLEDASNLGQRSFTLDFANGRLLRQQVSGADAVRQSLSVLSLTPRGLFVAFSEDYGTDIEDIIGQPLPQEVLELEIADEIVAAIEADPRVNTVEVRTEKDGDKLTAYASVSLTDGAEIIVERGVEV